ncbi:hypothetical protein GCM10027445_44310 [Amycolatopsis endophytica]|uniref:PE domain-containing protein n=1 Tax=Amycolatopsis endophytica TaxID=860233 RepID=A0A853BCS0_9PSEU|nr:hypothetical protein [Amycolatopsis endophytica]NYI93208.1 hypothetical protein [Amycolatopsis endophytica]
MSEDAQKPVEAVSMMRAVHAVALKKMATEGGFAVDEQTGEKMIQALQGMVDALEERWSTLQAFGDAPPMSSGATATWVSDVMVKTASDDRGLLTQLQQAKAELPTYIEAIRLAQKNYESQDGDTGTALSRLRADQA